MCSYLPSSRFLVCVYALLMPLRMTRFTQRIFQYPPKLINAACLVVTLVPRDSIAVSVQVLCTPYNYAPFYSVSLFQATYVGCTDVCLVVTCHLHFWQNDRDLLHATAVTRVCGTDTEIRVCTKGWPWPNKQNKTKTKNPAAPVETRTRDLSIMSPSLYH